MHDGNSLAEREALKSSKIEQIFEMQEQFDNVMQNIKASFKKQIRK